MSVSKNNVHFKEVAIPWIGTLPMNWDSRKAKYLFNRKQRPIPPNSGIITAFRDGEVTLRSKRRTDGFTVALKEIGYQGVKAGDLLIHSMDAFAGAIGVSDSDGRCSPVCNVCVGDNEVFSPYYGYLLRVMAKMGHIL